MWIDRNLFSSFSMKGLIVSSTEKDMGITMKTVDKIKREKGAFRQDKIM